MLTVLLWNINDQPLGELIETLVVEHRVDVLVLVESRNVIPRNLLRRLGKTAPFEYVPSAARFGVYVRFSRSFMLPVRLPRQEGRMAFWRLAMPLRREILFGIVHGLDKRNHDAKTQRLFLRRAVEYVNWVESGLAHKRTVLLGDFNANPFEEAIASADGLHAIPMKSVSGRTYRDVEKTRYEFFYNPMWSCYSVRNSPPATYYFYKYAAHELFWHMLDGVVIRPELLDCFPENELRILSQAGTRPLVTPAGMPDIDRASDHLPVLFRLDLKLQG